MLSDAELEDLYEENGKPYTAEELELHRKNRDIKSELEVEHAYNYEAISNILEWIDFLDGRRDVPRTKIWQIIRPTKAIVNDRCSRLQKIFNYFAHWDYGECPRFPIVTYCSRSSATVMDLLEKVYSTPHFANANEALLELTMLVSNHKIHSSIKGEKFADALSRLVKIFLEEMRTYSRELSAHLTPLADASKNAKNKPNPTDEKIAASLEHIADAVTKGAKTIAASKTKKRGKHSSFPIALQNLHLSSGSG